MNRPVTALAGVALLAAGIWFLQDQDPDRPTGTDDTGASNSTSTDPNRASARTGANTPQLDPEQIKANLLAQRTQERGSTDADQGPGSQDTQPIDYWSLPESAYFQTYHTQDMARLQWQKNTTKGRFVTTWFHKKCEVDARLFNDVLTKNDDEQIAAMRAYNEFTSTKRRELVQGIGLADADHVLNTYAIYEFDLQKRNWHRIDASGQEVPFLHPDHDIWENGETGGAPWTNHQ